tara:strand:+ start:81 stop:356 length:276 start_codon:yes stop_codon:yes gene_type:complete
MFLDDPKAINEDRKGRVFSQYHLSSHVCLGKPHTLEEAQEMYRRDINKENLFEASFTRKVTRPNSDAQKAYYWRNREKILSKLQTKKKENK